MQHFGSAHKKKGYPPPLKSMKATSTTMKARAMNTRFPRVLPKENFSTDTRSPRVFKKIHVR